MILALPGPDSAILEDMRAKPQKVTNSNWGEEEAYESGLVIRGISQLMRYLGLNESTLVIIFLVLLLIIIAQRFKI